MKLRRGALVAGGVSCVVAGAALLWLVRADPDKGSAPTQGAQGLASTTAGRDARPRVPAPPGEQTLDESPSGTRVALSARSDRAPGQGPEGLTGREHAAPGELEEIAKRHGVSVELVTNGRRFLWLVEYSRNWQMIDEMLGHALDESSKKELTRLGNETLRNANMTLQHAAAKEISEADALAVLREMEQSYRQAFIEKSGLSPEQFASLYDLAP